MSSMNFRLRGTTTVTATAVTVALVIAGAVADLGVGAANGVNPANAVSSALAVAAFVIVGAVLGVVRPAHRIGWFMLSGAVGWSLGGAAVELGVYGLRTRPGSIPGAAIYSVAGEAVRGAGWALIVVAVAVVFPDGHLAGPRWRWLGRVTVIAIGLLVLAQFLAPTLEETRLSGTRNPIGLPMSWSGPTSLMELVGTGLLSVAAIGSVVQLVGRWRHGGPMMRQQLIVFSIAICLPALVPLMLVTGGIPPWLFGVSVLPLPIAIAVAVLQNRLYDLHLAVNRTLLWVGLSGAVIAMYVLIIGGVGGILDASGARWLPWVATGVVAVSFAPLRTALQAAVNRITYGRWEQPYDVLADIGQRLEAAADTGRLLESVADELTGGLGLPAVVIRDADGTILVRRGEVTAAATEQALIAYGEMVGSLAYVRGPATRAGDARLLEDLARQLGGVLHARNLVAALLQARERLVLAREEERRRLRRDLHDGVGPALAGLILKVDTIGNVLPPDASAQPARDRLRLLRDDVQATVLDVRRVVEGLRPPALDELGLAAALRQATARLAAEARVAVAVHADEALPELSAAVEVAAFRIAVEATTNVVRHAGATTCAITLTGTPDRLLVTITDDGRGVHPGTASTGNGMATMRERAGEVGGTLSVSTTPAGGTVVVAELPRNVLVPVASGA
jgi:signal transduction histidine kinase